MSFIHYALFVLVIKKPIWQLIQHFNDVIDSKLTSTRTRSFFFQLKKNRSFFVVFLYQFHRLKKNTLFFRCFFISSIVDHRFNRLFSTFSHHDNRFQFSIIILLFHRITKIVFIFRFFSISKLFLLNFFLSSFFHEKFVYFDNNRINFNRIKINKINVNTFNFCFFRKKDFTNFINFN